MTTKHANMRPYMKLDFDSQHSSNHGSQRNLRSTFEMNTNYMTSPKAVKKKLGYSKKGGDVYDGMAAYHKSKDGSKTSFTLSKMHITSYKPAKTRKIGAVYPNMVKSRKGSRQTKSTALSPDIELSRGTREDGLNVIEYDSEDEQYNRQMVSEMRSASQGSLHDDFELTAAEIKRQYRNQLKKKSDSQAEVARHLSKTGNRQNQPTMGDHEKEQLIAELKRRQSNFKALKKSNSSSTRRGEKDMDLKINAQAVYQDSDRLRQKLSRSSVNESPSISATRSHIKTQNTFDEGSGAVTFEREATTTFDSRYSPLKKTVPSLRGTGGDSSGFRSCVDLHGELEDDLIIAGLRPQNSVGDLRQRSGSHNVSGEKQLNVPHTFLSLANNIKVTDVRPHTSKHASTTSQDRLKAFARAYSPSMNSQRSNRNKSKDNPLRQLTRKLKSPRGKILRGNSKTSAKEGRSPERSSIKDSRQLLGTTRDETNGLSQDFQPVEKLDITDLGSQMNMLKQKFLDKAHRWKMAEKALIEENRMLKERLRKYERSSED